MFNTRSPARPNPIGLHEVTILAIEGGRADPAAVDRGGTSSQLILLAERAVPAADQRTVAAVDAVVTP